MMLKQKIATKYFFLITIGILTEIVYLLFFFIEPFRKNILGETSLIMADYTLFFFVLAILFINFVLFLIAYIFIENEKRFTKIIFSFLILFTLTLFISWPSVSVDVFSYIGIGRIVSQHHENPYIVPYNDLKNDLLYDSLNNYWLSIPTPYPPIFIYLISFITFLTGNNLILGLYAVKFTFAFLHILTAFLIYKTFKDNKLVLLYAWNPLFLFEFAQTGHSDIVTLFFFAISLYFFLKKNSSLKTFLFSWFFLLIATLIKYSTIVLLPIFFFGTLFLLKNKKDKAKFFIYGSLIAISSLLFYLPFLNNVNIFIDLKSFLNISVQKDPNSIGFFPPLLLLILMPIINFFTSNDIRLLAIKICRYTFYTVFVLTSYKLFKKYDIISKKSIILVSTIILSTFIFTYYNWVMPWYYATMLLSLLYYYKKSNSSYALYFYYIMTFICISYYIILR